MTRFGVSQSCLRPVNNGRSLAITIFGEGNGDWWEIVQWSPRDRGESGCVLFRIGDSINKRGEKVAGENNSESWPEIINQPIKIILLIQMIKEYSLNLVKQQKFFINLKKLETMNDKNYPLISVFILPSWNIIWNNAFLCQFYIPLLSPFLDEWKAIRRSLAGDGRLIGTPSHQVKTIHYPSIHLPCSQLGADAPSTDCSDN